MTHQPNIRSSHPWALFKQRLAKLFGRPARIRIVLSADRTYTPLVAYVADDGISFRHSPNYR